MYTRQRMWQQQQQQQQQQEQQRLWSYGWPWRLPGYLLVFITVNTHSVRTAAQAQIAAGSACLVSLRGHVQYLQSLRQQ